MCGVEGSDEDFDRWAKLVIKLIDDVYEGAAIKVIKEDDTGTTLELSPHDIEVGLLIISNLRAAYIHNMSAGDVSKMAVMHRYQARRDDDVIRQKIAQNLSEEEPK
jgi:hypothetical protein